MAEETEFTLADVQVMVNDAAEDEAAGREEIPFVEEPALPPEFVIPGNVRPPPDGVTVTFMRILGKNSFAPTKGDRWCALWVLTDADETLALKRAQSGGAIALAECAKQCIRVIDGEKADWTNSPGKGIPVKEFWREIGPKYRNEIINWYGKMHGFDAADRKDFLEQSLFVTTVSSGR
jgi:hypothetical protein